MKKKLFIGLIATFVIIVLTSIAFAYPGWKIQNWDKEKVVTLEGKITDADRPIIMESDGKEYILHIGPAGYWQDKGIKTEKGNSAKITGMVVDVNGKMNVYPQTLAIEGKELKVADESGTPAWAGTGRGYRGGNGAGMMRGQHGRHGMQGQRCARQNQCGPCWQK
jgi:hypothetical protein